MNVKLKNTIICVLAFVIITSVSVLVVGACFAIVPIDGDSMSPTIDNGNKVFILTVGSFDRGDVVVFENNGTRLIKRIIALGGDTIESRVEGDEIVYYVNDEKLTGDKYVIEKVSDYTSQNRFYHTQNKITVPDGSFYYMGDNRYVSYDSRSFFLGETIFGDVESIQGKVLFRYDFDGRVMVGSVK